MFDYENDDSLSPQEKERMRLRVSTLNKNLEKDTEVEDDIINEPEISDDFGDIENTTNISVDEFINEEKEDDKTEEEQEKSDDEEVESDELVEEIEDKKVDEPKKDDFDSLTKKENEELRKQLKEQQDLLLQLHELSLIEKRDQLTKNKENEPAKPSKEELKAKKLKEAIELIGDLKTDEAVTSLLEALKEDEKPQFSEEQIEQYLAKREQKRYEEEFKKAQEDFLNSEIGKKVVDLAQKDEDFSDVFNLKFSKLQATGKYKPKELFDEAYKQTAKSLKLDIEPKAKVKTEVKINDDILKDISEKEKSKEVGVKPSSGTKKETVAQKPKSNIELWKEMQRKMGRM